MSSDVVTLGDRGTPQGSVIAPVLFNLCMIGLSRKLKEVEGIDHTIYADDLTIWCSSGSEGQIQDSLNEAIKTVDTPDSFLSYTDVTLKQAVAN